eukprot:gene12739-15986_t
MDTDAQSYVNGILESQYEDAVQLNKVLDDLATKYNDDDIWKHVRSELYKKQGIKEEEHIRQNTSKKNNMNITQNDKFVAHHLFTINNVDIRIGGRHDGLSADGSVVEIKNRMNKFLGVPEYSALERAIAKFGSTQVLARLEELKVNIRYIDQTTQDIAYILARASDEPLLPAQELAPVAPVAPVAECGCKNCKNKKGFAECMQVLNDKLCAATLGKDVGMINIILSTLTNVVKSSM